MKILPLIQEKPVRWASQVGQASLPAHLIKAARFIGRALPADFWRPQAPLSLTNGPWPLNTFPRSATAAAPGRNILEIARLADPTPPVLSGVAAVQFAEIPESAGTRSGQVSHPHQKTYP